MANLLRKPQNGGNGGGYREEVAYTMDTIGNFGIAQVEDDMEQKIFTLDADRSNSMKSANPNSGIHESNVAKTLDTTTPTPQKAQGGQMIVAYDARGNGDGKTANTITGDHANRVTDFTPIVAQADGFKPRNSSSARSLGYENNNSPTIDTSQNVAIVVHGSQDPISNTEHANAVNRNNGLENCIAIGVDGYNQSKTGDVSKTISSAASDYHHVPCAAIPINSMVIGKDIKEGDRQTTGIGKEDDPCPTLQTEHHHAVANHLSVRRLLPVECERLMGFPDNWTKIPWRGKSADECPDAPRYKACGNSMGVNCMRWIGLGIEAVEAKHRK